MIVGYIDNIEPNSVSGWCYDNDKPTERLMVTVYHGANIIAQDRAASWRPDLTAVTEKGDIAFNIDFNRIEKPEDIHIIATDSDGRAKELEMTSIAKCKLKKIVINTINKETGAHKRSCLWIFAHCPSEYSTIDSIMLHKKTGHNSGNLVFTEAISREINFDIRYEGTQLPNEALITVLPCANMLGSHYDATFLMNKTRAAACAFVAIGLGAQELKEDQMPTLAPNTIEWLKYLTNHAYNDAYPNISVRGEYTKKVLEYYGFKDKCVPLGCPSLFLNPERTLGKKIARNWREPKRFAVVGGQVTRDDLQKIEASLAWLVSMTDGAYVIQSDLALFQACRGEYESMSPTGFEHARKFILPGMSRSQALEWFRKYGRVFFDIDSWMEFYKHFDFVIGARIHGVALAIQAGVPALCIAHDTRTLELCQIMKIPYILASEIKECLEMSDIKRLFFFDPDKFDQNRKELAGKYIDFLKNNSLRPTNALKNIVE